jgi:septum formation protein
VSTVSKPPLLILASASPRRQQLLHEHGYAFQIDPADIDEADHPPELAPGALALLLARRKAAAVATKHRADVVLAADTVVALGALILGKPVDAHHAAKMLRQLAGTTHEVITGICVVRTSAEFSKDACVISTVQMRVLSEREIDNYVASGDWRGKAGGYGIQDPDPFVTRMTGSLTNIVGLPMDETSTLLRLAGVSPRRFSGA